MLARTLEWQDPTKPWGGFPRRTLREDNASALEYVPGLLDGACGVALVLLAALTSLAPDWDRHLLVSLPPKCLA